MRRREAAVVMLGLGLKAWQAEVGEGRRAGRRQNWHVSCARDLT